MTRPGPWSLEVLRREAEAFAHWGEPCCRRCALEEALGSLARVQMACLHDPTPLGLALRTYLQELGKLGEGNPVDDCRKRPRSRRIAPAEEDDEEEMDVTSRTWKHAESQIAVRLGGRRVPVNGRSGPDVEHPLLALEVKARKSLPAPWREWLGQAQAGASAGKLPCLVIHELNRRYDDDLVVMTLADFEQLPGVVNDDAD